MSEETTDGKMEDSSRAPASNDVQKDNKCPHESRQIEERTCHMMPCSIDFQGMAATHVYFRPVETDGVFSSTFRGRGLLALGSLSKDEEKQSDEESPFLSTALLSVQNNHLQIKADIDRVLEWKHEHNAQSLFVEDGDHSSRVQVARDWAEVSLALHEPIPIKESVDA